MRTHDTRHYLTRYGAPAAFLAAATAAVLLIRAGLRDEGPSLPAQGRTPAALVSRTPARAPAARHRRFYVIRAGDTLEAIAGRLGTSVERLLVLNPGIAPTSLRIGQRIRTE
jgi:phage tail protein X